MPAVPTPTLISASLEVAERVTAVVSGSGSDAGGAHEVRIVPPSPTATKVLLPKVTPQRERYVSGVCGTHCGTHVGPSNKVRIVPSSPTATKVLLPKVTP